MQPPGTSDSVYYIFFNNGFTVYIINSLSIYNIISTSFDITTTLSQRDIRICPLFSGVSNCYFNVMLIYDDLEYNCFYFCRASLCSN